MKPDILVLVPMPEPYLSQIAARFNVHDASAPGVAAALTSETRAKVRGVVTTGPAGLTRADIDSMPRLEIVHALGAGLDRIDLVAARERGIVVTCGSGTNAPTVADHALALILSLLRNVPSGDAAVRAGKWPDVQRPLLTGKRVGILGLGQIGMAIAQRVAGFDTTVAYHNRHVRPDVAFHFYATPRELAANSDVLMVALPGNDETRHLVDGDVLAALGPQGYVVNVGRGSVIDTGALAAALAGNIIAGAALDVFEGEPRFPEVLSSVPNLIVTPHMAGMSAEALHAARQRAVDNLDNHFAGGPVAGRVILS